MISSQRQVAPPLLVVVALGLVLSLGAKPVQAEPFGWPQPGGAGTPIALSYSFVDVFLQNFQGISELQLRIATAEAFATWSQYAPLHFVERPDSGPPASDDEYVAGSHPDIRIGAHELADGFILAHAFFPIATGLSGLAGDVHFNLSTYADWGIGRDFPTIDFREVMLHEIGHALGLPHVDDINSIMHPSHQFLFGSLTPAFLMRADIAALQALYGAGEGSVAPVPEPGTLVLVTAGLVMGLASRARRRGSGPRQRARPI